MSQCPARFLDVKPRRPAIYVRISDDREGEAKGVKRQLEDCRALVEQRGWPAAAEYNDNDVSAWKRGVVRPRYRQ
jgi:site-specific DNA recombinase